MAKINIPTFKLNSGYEIPALGYGTWLGFNDKADDIDYTGWDEMLGTLSYSIDVGYRHIDTAHLYRVEPGIGEVIEKKIEEGVVTREELFITTKVWQHCHRKEDVETSVRGSLRRLGLEYLDLVLIHWPMSISQDGVDEKIDYLETWRGFESVLRAGLARSIGVSNFNLGQMKRLVANCKIKPAVLQIEVNLANGQKELVDYCNTQDIRVTGWAPFGAMIASRALPGAPPPKADDPTLVAIAKKYGKTVMQVTLRYLYQRGIITIPKTVTRSRVVENASIFDFVLTPSEVSTLAKFDVKYRSDVPTFWQNYTNYPFEKYDVPPSPIPKCLLRWKNGKNKDIE